MTRGLLPFPLVLLMACGGSPAEGAASETDTDTETDAGSGGSSATDSGPSSDGSSGPGSTGVASDSASGGSSGGTGGTGGSDDNLIRFIAVGDAGEGNDAQFAVADSIEQVCSLRGCDFVMYLGDNFYDTGVNGTLDQQFTDKFELPYMDIDLRFYVVLGNHDYGLLFNDWSKSAYEIDYTNFSDKWYLPNEWYDFRVEHVSFFAMDTARLMFDHETGAQQAWLDQAVADSDATWKIMFGHHPYVSNGSHGNAGNYDGVPLLDEVNGTDVKSFMDASLCGKAHVYFSGHDHTRQWLAPQCGTEFIVSGAGAKVTGLAHRDDNPTFYEDDQTPGFMWVEISGNDLTGVFYDQDGVATFERSVSI